MSPTLHKAAFIMALLLGSALASCAHSPEEGGGAGFGRNTAEARITHLISEGQFVEAEALIAESASSGLIEQSVNDFSLASKKKFQTALKLLKDAAKDSSRLLQKL